MLLPFPQITLRKVNVEMNTKKWEVPATGTRNLNSQLPVRYATYYTTTACWVLCVYRMCLSFCSSLSHHCWKFSFFFFFLLEFREILQAKSCLIGFKIKSNDTLWIRFNFNVRLLARLYQDMKLKTWIQCLVSKEWFHQNCETCKRVGQFSCEYFKVN